MIESYLSDSTLVLLPIVFVCYYYIMWSSKGSFARKQLEKHGWTDGVGLGAKEHGITQAIKVKLKMDSAGVGHDPAQEFTHHWWDHAFNKAVSNITVEAKEDGVIVRSSKKSKKEEVAVQKKAAYGNFVKVSLLSNGIEEEMTAGVKHDDEEEDSSRKTQTLLLPEDELFKRCGGRTAHKAARHGLKLNGKLQRIEEQERLLLEKYQPQSLLSTDQEKSAMKMSIQSEPKLVNHKLSSELRQSDMHASSQYDLPDPQISNTLNDKRKKKSKKRKRNEVSEDDVKHISTYQENKTKYLCNSENDIGFSRPEKVCNKRKHRLEKGKDGTLNVTSDTFSSSCAVENKTKKDLKDGIACSDYSEAMVLETDSANGKKTKSKKKNLEACDDLPEENRAKELNNDCKQKKKKSKRE